MLTTVQRFVGLLRRAGVSVSVAETLDAAAAIERVGAFDGALFRSALRSTLVKRPVDRETFDELFRLYFDSSARVTDEALQRALVDVAVPTRRALMQGVAGLGDVARYVLGVHAVDVAGLLKRLNISLDPERLQTPLQFGFVSYRVMAALDSESAVADLGRLFDSLQAAGGLSSEVRTRLEDVARGNVGALRAAVRRHVERLFAQAHVRYRERTLAYALLDKPFAQLALHDHARLRHEVWRLARALRGQLRPRPARNSARIDVRATMRTSVRTGGVPFVISYRRRRPVKPRLVVLCDVSDSVAYVSRFFLQFVYALHESFEHIDSFAFVSDLAPLRRVFRARSFERAVEIVLSGQLFNVFSKSNYGAALEQFCTSYYSLVSRRTTVVMIGDGRNNHNATRADLLGMLARKAKAVWWLSPESRASWGFGDSAMFAYEPHCDRVRTVTNLASLREVVAELVATT